MIVKSAVQRYTRIYQIARSSVRFYHDKQKSYDVQDENSPVGPFCTSVGYAMASMSYAGALVGGKSTEEVKSSSNGGSSSNTTDTPPRHSKHTQVKTLESEWSARYEKAKENSTLPLPEGAEIDLTYPPDNFPPIIISAWLDDPIQEHFSGLRSKYFPASRNYIQGHITLFQCLPSDQLDFILATLQKDCSATKAFEIFCKPYKLTNNAAVFIPLKAKQLESLRMNLRGTFMRQFSMTHQDINPNFNPHATVANKVTREEAERIFEEVKSLPTEDKTQHGRALGLDVWFYRGGPWEHIRRIPFSEAKSSKKKQESK